MKNTQELAQSFPDHSEMLTIIQDNLPEINRASTLFRKTQSQFMDNMLTVSHPTPIRNLRQILAEVESTTLALKESHFKNRKKEIEIQILERDIKLEKDNLKADLIQVEIEEKYSELETSRGYVSGAIRKLTNYNTQYISIMDSMGLKDFDEIDFEKEESRYHVMKAFEQGLISARPRQGVIDEGNQIYFYQVGINGTMAQREVMSYLNEEGKMISEGKTPTHSMTLKFLNDMADKYSKNYKDFAEWKGMTGVVTEEASIVKKLEEK